MSGFQLATRVCPAKPSRRNLKPARANHAVPTAPLCDVDSTCCADNSSLFPVVHGIATAVEHYQDPPQDPAVAALKRNLQLDVNWRSHGVDPLATQAPLASPEPLSETSSIASYGSDSFRRQLSGDRRWVCRTAMRMDPIRQSPLCRSSPPSARLVLSDVETSAVSGLCFPVDELQPSAESSCSLMPTTIQPLSTTCQTIVEVHHHQDSPTQNEASKSLSDFVSEQTDDNLSAELLSVDTPSAPPDGSAMTVDRHDMLDCLHEVADCPSDCKCIIASDISDSQKVNGGGQLYHSPQPSSRDCQSSVLSCLGDATSEELCNIDQEVNCVKADQL